MCWKDTRDPQLVYQIEESNRQITYLTGKNKELEEKIIVLEQKLKELEEKRQ
jgi:peptidoglycan hydrolase CwlO-like protein